VSGGPMLHLGPLSLPLWLIVAVLAVTHLTLNLNQAKSKEDMQMIRQTSKTVLATLTGIAEMVWDIGTKVAAAGSRGASSLL
jgi:hypothetical protein